VVVLSRYDGRRFFESAGQAIGFAQRIGYAEGPGHVLDEARGLGDSEPRRSNEQRSGRLSAPDLNGMRGSPERGLRDADDGYPELVMNVSAKPRSAIRIQVDVSINQDERKRSRVPADGQYRRELAQVELARTVGRDVGQLGRPGTCQTGEPRVSGGYKRRPRASRSFVMDIHRSEQA
jgi:hypothetical protein